MKKLMIAACAFAFAAVANAATATWGTDENGSLMDPSGNDVAWNNDGYITMYLWSIDSTTYGTLNQGGASKVSAAVWNSYGKKLDTAMSFADEAGSGQLLVSDTTGYSVGQTAYAAIVLAYDEGDGATYYKGNIGSYTFDADGEQVNPNMDMYIYGDTSGTALAWTKIENVPEPFSGTLALLGMGAIALRRKMKKAKKA